MRRLIVIAVSVSLPGSLVFAKKKPAPPPPMYWEYNIIQAYVGETLPPEQTAYLLPDDGGTSCLFTHPDGRRLARQCEHGKYRPSYNTRITHLLDDPIFSCTFKWDIEERKAYSTWLYEIPVTGPMLVQVSLQASSGMTEFYVGSGGNREGGTTTDSLQRRLPLDPEPGKTYSLRAGYEVESGSLTWEARLAQSSGVLARVAEFPFCSDFDLTAPPPDSCPRDYFGSCMCLGERHECYVDDQLTPRETRLSGVHRHRKLPEQERVTICHTAGTPAQTTMLVPAPAFQDHLLHGDRKGACGD